MMGYGWGMGSGWIYMLVFWVLLVAVIVWAVTRLTPRSEEGNDAARHRETPLEVLQRRLANGEIEPEEYLKIRNQLEATSKT